MENETPTAEQKFRAALTFLVESAMSMGVSGDAIEEAFKSEMEFVRAEDGRQKR